MKASVIELSDGTSGEDVAAQVGLNPEMAQALEVFRGELTQRVFNQVDSLRNDMLADTRKRTEELMASVMGKLANIKPMAMHIKIDNGPVVNLNGAIHPIMTDLIFHAKMSRTVSCMNPCLVGPKGCGKTFVVGQLAKALGMKYLAVTLPERASISWVLGLEKESGHKTTRFIEACRGTDGPYVILIDEADSLDANFAMVFQTLLSSRILENPVSGESFKVHPDTIFVAATNTHMRGADGQYAARNRLDAATIDRFVFLDVDYSPEIEKQVCPDDELRTVLQTARKKLRSKNNPETISSRKLEIAHVQKHAGYTMARIVAMLTSGWSKETIMQAGLDVWNSVATGMAGAKEAF